MKFKKHKKFLYLLYQPNRKRFPHWFEYYIEKDTDEVVYPFDSVMSFAFNGKPERTKAQAEEDAKKMIERYYSNPSVKEMFDMERL
jgi:hypothetical protein